MDKQASTKKNRAKKSKILPKFATGKGTQDFSTFIF
jgi:hypothetical protein